MNDNLLDDFDYLEKEKPRLVYVGLLPRFAATMIDGGVAFGIFLLYVLLTPVFVEEDLAGFLYGIAMLLYFPILESSKYQATIGKQVFKIKVIDKEGNRLSFGRALARFASKFLSYIIVCLGFVMIAFTKNNQGFHDIIVETYVVESKNSF